MLLAMVAALGLANSPLAAYYQQFIGLSLPGLGALHTVVVDDLMPIFFLMIGIELLHEMTAGTLVTRAQKILPLIAAAGGAVVPALLFLAMTYHAPEYRAGWAIPTATDIAFALCVLNLVGKNMPPAAKIFLLAIAIYDDLAAILIIAVFYSHGVAWLPLLGAAGCVAALAGLRRLHVAHLAPYLLLGAGLAALLHAGGVHATIAGVLTGFFIPRPTAERAMRWLHPLVSFAILPLFAFVSAGISFAAIPADAWQSPLVLGIALGLCVGKPLGITSATWLAVRFRLADLPKDTSWRVLRAIATLAGVGFTMSLFIGQLAFQATPDLVNIVALSVLAASALAALLGGWLLRRAQPY